LIETNFHFFSVTLTLNYFAGCEIENVLTNVCREKVGYS
jgi:hypothetical protein